MESKYRPNTFEKKWYQEWLKNNCFASKPNKHKKPYTVVIPPPNITGILHMGHVLNNTIQDVLVRKARMEGREVCWVPGTDHASIATEAKVVALLKTNGIDKKNISREDFLQHTWKWKEKYGNIILDQLKALGVSCDWNRTTFTMDPHMYEAVQKTFITLYNDGLIYRDTRMVNWDPVGKTSLADDEVIYKESQSDLVYIKYQLVNSENYITVATTRPETIFGDTAICCNPNDERYKKLKNQKARVPLINREIPIIFDEYVDKDFGTGCLKITPAHHSQDYIIGNKFKLEKINILTEEANLNDNCLNYKGLSVFEARKIIIQDLQNLGLIERIEKISNKIGHSERTNAIVECRISTQWFVKMQELAQPAIEAVKTRKIKFFPDRFEGMYNSWLNNIENWCISRQLWWGHRIPAFYLPDGRFVVAINLEEAFILAKNLPNTENLTKSDLKQDPDVLDTWFSSWLWPLEVFNGVTQKDNDEFNYYYPTNDLVTAPEIIFFWVARMIMAGYYVTGKAPFENVYFTGIVRDAEKRKMSKSLGNSPDPLDLIEKYGADGIRLGMMLCASAGNDLLFDEKLCEQGRNFVNKLWNASILTKKFCCNNSKANIHSTANEWINSRFNSVLTEIAEELNNFRLSQALMSIYKFVWDDFCSTYLEMIKNHEYELDESTYSCVRKILKDILHLLHPFIPFATEEIWQKMFYCQETKFLCVSNWPKKGCYNKTIEKDCETFMLFVTTLRSIKKENDIPNSKSIDIWVEKQIPAWLKTFKIYAKKFLNADTLILENENTSKFIAIEIAGSTFFIDVSQYSEKTYSEVEIKKIKDEFENLQKYILTLEQKLSNEKFLSKASSEVIEKEKLKLNEAEIKSKALRSVLSQSTK